MRITRVLLSAALLLTSSQVYGQDPSLQQALNKLTFASTRLRNGQKCRLLTPGTSILEKDNLLLYSPANAHRRRSIVTTEER